jgi:hypothetical protein
MESLLGRRIKIKLESIVPNTMGILVKYSRELKVARLLMIKLNGKVERIIERGLRVLSSFYIGFCWVIYFINLFLLSAV